jgi:sugar phosphate isomerase/epimerase
MKFGTLQGVLGEPLPEVFAVARELGFDGVELDWRNPAEAQEGGALGPENRAAIVKAAQTAGVEIPSVAAHFLNGGGIASANPETRQAGLDALRTGIQLCRDLGAKALLVPFFGDAEMETAEDKERLVESLNQLAPAAENANVTLAIEHTLRGDEAAQLLEKVRSTHIGDYFDMANCMCFGYNPVREVEMLGYHIAQVHAKEYDRGDAELAPRSKGQYPNLNPKPFGEGQVPVKGVLTALQQAGYDGYVVLETGSFGDRRGAAKRALEVLRHSL